MADLKIYTDEKFIKGEGLFHCFFTRLGGVSTALYEGLNCALTSGDDLDSIIGNRRKVAHAAGTLDDFLVTLTQVHGAKVVMVQQPFSEEVKGDALVTDKPGIALGILTADCAPVLFYGRKADGGPVIGAAHAGSKGALLGVLDNCFKAMVELGAVADGIKACVGPCISKTSYEVGTDFIEPFTQKHEEAERFFSSASKQGHALFDLSGYCAWRLYLVGCKNVSLLDLDTYSNDAEFYSYRRSRHRQEADYGRQISVISIRK